MYRRKSTCDDYSCTDDRVQAGSRCDLHRVPSGTDRPTLAKWQGCAHGCASYEWRESGRCEHWRRCRVYRCQRSRDGIVARRCRRSMPECLINSPALSLWTSPGTLSGGAPRAASNRAGDVVPSAVASTPWIRRVHVGRAHDGTGQPGDLRVHQPRMPAQSYAFSTVQMAAAGATDLQQVKSGDRRAGGSPATN
jgi:hypothetical protein